MPSNKKITFIQVLRDSYLPTHPRGDSIVSLGFLIKADPSPVVLFYLLLVRLLTKIWQKGAKYKRGSDGCNSVNIVSIFWSASSSQVLEFFAEVLE